MFISDFPFFKLIFHAETAAGNHSENVSSVDVDIKHPLTFDMGKRARNREKIGEKSLLSAPILQIDFTRKKIIVSDG